MCHCAYRPCPRLVTSTCTSTEYCNQGASKLSNTTDWAAEIARGGQITAPPSGPRIPWLRRRMIHIWGGPSRWSWGGLELIKIVLDIATADGQLHLEGSYWIRMMEDGGMKTRLWVLRGPEDWGVPTMMSFRLWDCEEMPRDSGSSPGSCWAWCRNNRRGQIIRTTGGGWLSCHWALVCLLGGGGWLLITGQPLSVNLQALEPNENSLLERWTWICEVMWVTSPLTDHFLL